MWAWCWMVHLVTTDTSVAQVPNAFCSSVCQKKVSQASLLKELFQGGAELPAVNED